MFYDREDELETLEKEFSTDGFSFVVIYGRRRIGKTELIKEFCEDKPHIYHLVSQDSEKLQREKLVSEISHYFDERTPRIDNWDEAVDYIAEKIEEENLVLAIDEFPYLVESNNSIPSHFQKLVDETTSDSMLILCGSSIGVMESEVLGHKSPLYGRRTSQIDLKEFGFTQAKKVITYEIEDAIRSYSVTGGTPMYLLLFDYDKPLEENIRNEILSKNSVLYNEPEFLLRTELRNPSRYMSVLEAVANGYTTTNEISGQTDIPPGTLSNYLTKLRRLRLIDRVVPVTESKKKSKRSIYRIKDNFLRFWFRFVETNPSGIEEAPEIVLEEEILPELDRYVSKTFEDVCAEVLWELNRNEELEKKYSKIGKWWYKDTEIDLVGLNPNTPSVVFCECKWTNTKTGTDTANILKKKSENMRWKKDDRKEEFVLFSRSGFTDEAKSQFSKENSWHLYDLEKLVTLES